MSSFRIEAIVVVVCSRKVCVSRKDGVPARGVLVSRVNDVTVAIRGIINKMAKGYKHLEYSDKSLE